MHLGLGPDNHWGDLPREIFGSESAAGSELQIRKDR